MKKILYNIKHFIAPYLFFDAASIATLKPITINTKLSDYSNPYLIGEYIPSLKECIKYILFRKTPFTSKNKIKISGIDYYTSRIKIKNIEYALVLTNRERTIAFVYPFVSIKKINEVYDDYYIFSIIDNNNKYNYLSKIMEIKGLKNI